VALEPDEDCVRAECRKYANSARALMIPSSIQSSPMKWTSLHSRKGTPHLKPSALSRIGRLQNRERISGERW
jgi:hypothetical protein